MKMSIEMITTLSGEGRLSLQIPEFDIDTRTGISLAVESAKNVVDMPDDWFMRTNGYDLPCVGRQEGFLFLTRKGYEANKQHIKDAFEKAIKKGLDRTDGRGWVAFEEYVETLFTRMAKSIDKKIKYYQKMEAELKSKRGCVIP